MGVMESWVELMKSELMPSKKVLTAYAAAGAVSGIAWVLGKRGYKVPRQHVQKVVTAAVALASLVPPTAAYMKADRPRKGRK